MEAFSNRELATGAWLLLLVAVTVPRSQVRKSLGSLLRAFFHPKMLGLTLSVAAYTGVVVSGLEAIEWWEPALLKDTVFWFILIGIVTVFRFANRTQHESIVRSAIVENIKAIVIIEFLVNTYGFSLAVELVFVPIISIITMLVVVASTERKFEAVASVASWILAGIGFLILGIALTRAAFDFRELSSLDTLRSVLLAPLLSLSLVPFIYATSLIVTYESLFVRLGLGPYKDEKLKRYARLRILMHGGVNLKRIQYLLNKRSVELMRVLTRADIDNLLRHEPPPVV